MKTSSRHQADWPANVVMLDPPARPSRIDGNISDLFFNIDVTGAVMQDAHGMFTGYDATILRDEATMFLACLDQLGVATPTVDDLLADFHGRL